MQTHLWKKSDLAARDAGSQWMGPVEELYKLLGLAMSGSMELEEQAGEDLSLAGLGLNTAPAGSVPLWFEVPLLTAEDEAILHSWFQNPGAVSVACSFADAAPPDDPELAKLKHIDQGSGKPEWDTPIVAPVFENGKMGIIVILDTNDNGAEKIYTVDDTITVTVHAISGDEIMGYTVTTIDKVYTIVA